MPEKIFSNFDIVKMIPSDGVNPRIAWAEVIEPQRGILRVLPGGQGIIEKVLGVFGHFEMDAGEYGNFIFYFLLTQQIQDMVIDVNGGGNVVA